MIRKFEKHIQSDKEQSVLDCLSEYTDLSKQKIKQALQNGAVWLETDKGVSRVRRAKKIIKINQIVHIYYDALIQSSRPVAAELVADEGEYSVWNKPCGMYSQGSKWGDHCSIYRWSEQNLLPQRPAFLVHRLDRAANGLIVLAHTKTIAAKLSAMFESRQIYKKYRAVVEGLMTEIEIPYEINSELDGKSAISEIVELSFDKLSNTTGVYIVIKTGRKHQIRRHLSGMGFPIVGDRLYGASNTGTDLQLSSVNIRFECPVTHNAKNYQLALM